MTIDVVTEVAPRGLDACHLSVAEGVMGWTGYGWFRVRLLDLLPGWDCHQLLCLVSVCLLLLWLVLETRA